jgi:hypothetical protein
MGNTRRQRPKGKGSRKQRGGGYISKPLCKNTCATACVLDWTTYLSGLGTHMFPGNSTAYQIPPGIVSRTVNATYDLPTGTDTCLTACPSGATWKFNVQPRAGYSQYTSSSGTSGLPFFCHSKVWYRLVASTSADLFPGNLLSNTTFLNDNGTYSAVNGRCRFDGPTDLTGFTDTTSTLTNYGAINLSIPCSTHPPGTYKVYIGFSKNPITSHTVRPSVNAANDFSYLDYGFIGEVGTAVFALPAVNTMTTLVGPGVTAATTTGFTVSWTGTQFAKSYGFDYNSGTSLTPTTAVTAPTGTTAVSASFTGLPLSQPVNNFTISYTGCSGGSTKTLRSNPMTVQLASTVILSNQSWDAVNSTFMWNVTIPIAWTGMRANVSRRPIVNGVESTSTPTAASSFDQLGMWAAWETKPVTSVATVLARLKTTMFTFINDTTYTIALAEYYHNNSTTPYAAENRIGQSNTISITTPPPAPVLATTATNISPKGFTVSWTASATSTSVTLTQTPVGGTNTISGTTATFTGLNPNTAYSIRVTATNSAGSSSVSTPVSYTTGPSTPVLSAPTSVTATTFNIPWTGGAGPATLSTAFTVSPSGPTRTGTTNPATFTGAAPNTIYSLTAIATSTVTGASEQSAARSVITVPAAPTGVTSSNRTTTGFTLSFTAPTGTAAITSYIVRNATTILASSLSGTTLTITGLTANTTYSSVTITATNAAGTSLPSTAISVTTIPPAPTGLVSSLITTSGFRLVWTRVAGAIITYAFKNGATEVTSTITGGSASMSADSATISGLLSNTVHSITMSGTNAGGTSADSSALPVTTLPAAPTGLIASDITSSGFTLSFTPPPGTAPITTYTVRTSVTVLVSSPSGTSARTITGLAANTTYSFVTITATNAAGQSAYSTAINVTTRPLAITLVAPLAASVSQTGFSLGYTTPTEGGVAKTYRFLINDQPLASPAAVTVNSTNAIFTGLTPETTFSIKAFANNVSGPSAVSAAISCTTKPNTPVYTSTNPPTAPNTFTVTNITNATTTATKVSFKISWPIPRVGTTYTAVGGAAATSPTSTSVEILNVEPNSVYNVYVTATNSAGSQVSAKYEYRTGIAAPIFTTPGTITSTSFVTSGRVFSGTSSYSYSLDSNTTVVNLASPTGGTYSTPLLRFDNLSPSSLHTFSMTATDSNGYSVPSTVMSFITSPSPPTSITASNSTHNGFTLNWVGAATSYTFTIASCPMTISGTSACSTTFNAIIPSSLVGTTAVFNTLLPNTGYQIKIAYVSTPPVGGFGGGSGVTSAIPVATGPPQPTLTTFTRTSTGGASSNSFTIVIPAAYTGISGSPFTSITTTGATNFSYRINGTTVNPTETKTMIGCAITTSPNSSGFTVSNTIKTLTAAFSGLGPGSHTMIATAMTACGNSSSAPYNLVFPPEIAVLSFNSSTLSYDRFTVTWTGATGASSYIFKIDDQIVTPASIGPSGPTAAAATSSATFTGLSGSTAYRITLETSNSAGSSPVSTALTVTTKVAPPTEPTNLSFTAVTGDGFTVNWSGAQRASSYSYMVAVNSGTASAATPRSTTSNSATFGGYPPVAVVSIVITAINVAGTAPSSSATVTLLNPQQASAAEQQQSASSAVQQSVSSAQQQSASSATQQAASSAQQQSASSATQQGVSSAQQQSASSAQQQSASSATQQSASSAQQQSASSATQQGVSSAQQQSASSAVQQSASSATQQAASSAQQQSASSAQQQSASSATQQSASSAVQQSASSATQQAASSAQQQSASSAVQQGVSSAQQQSASSATQQSVSSAQQQSASSAVQQGASSAQQQSASSATQQSASSAIQQSASSAQQQSASSATQQSASSAQQQSASSATQQSVSSAQEQSASSAVQQSASSATQQSASSAQQQSASSAVQQGASSAQQQSASSATQQSASSAQQQSASSAQQQSASSATQQGVSSAQQQSASSAVQQSASSATQQSASSAQQQSASSAVQQGVSSAQQQSASSATQQTASSAQQEQASSAQQQSASSAVQQGVSSAQQQSASSAQQEQASSAQQQSASSAQQQQASSAEQQRESSAIQDVLSGKISMRKKLFDELIVLRTKADELNKIIYSPGTEEEKASATDELKIKVEEILEKQKEIFAETSTIRDINARYEDRDMQVQIPDRESESLGYTRWFDIESNKYFYRDINGTRAQNSNVAGARASGSQMGGRKTRRRNVLS